LFAGLDGVSQVIFLTTIPSSGISKFLAINKLE
jgi:hypothetical protein